MEICVSASMGGRFASAADRHERDLASQGDIFQISGGKQGKIQGTSGSKKQRSKLAANETESSVAN